MTDFLTWLRSLGLDRYAQVFADNDVDFDALRLLSEKDLQELGVSLGHRKKLLKAVAEFVDSPTGTEGEKGKWGNGETEVVSSQLSVVSPQYPTPNTQPPVSYTPPHLAERIRATSITDGERKTITALFADLKGSTALIEGLDPEEARAIIDPALQLMMDSVHHYEGYVAQALGDGIFALFGAPLAHEDHPQRALYAALRMQEEMRRYGDQIRLKHGVPLAMRVGINTGEVVVRSIRKDDLHTDYVPVGHSTNLAARMEQMATPGSILITEYTKKLVVGYFELKALGAAEIKGVETLLYVYEVVGAGPLRTRLQVAARRGLTRFVGRQSELEGMHKALDRAKAGHGQIVGVVGEPGLGKSRLFYEFVGAYSNMPLRMHGCLVLSAYSVSHGKASPYLPLIELLKSYFGIEPQDNERQRRAKVTGQVLVLDRTLEDTLPYLFALLGIEEQPSPLQQMDPQIRRRRTFEALKKLLLRESLNQPLILIFEDLHWIDSETQGFLDTLSEGVASAKVLLLVNYRPEYRHEWGSKTYYTQLRLAPFGQAEAEEFLDVLLGDAIGTRHASPLQALKHLILEKTEGTPFFMEEVVQELVEQGVLVHSSTVGTGPAVPTEGAASSVPTTSLHIPTTVQGVLAARIDRLAPDEKALLQQLAVIGREFPLGLVRQVIGQPEDDLYRLLSSLQRKEFLYEQPAFPESEYIFKHALTQEVAYGTVLHEQRKLLHERTGQALEALYAMTLHEHYSDLAHHYRRSANTEKAIRYLQLAGQQAVQHSANTEAISHLTAALDLLTTCPETPERAARELTLRLAVGPPLMAAQGTIAPAVEQNYTYARALSGQLGDSPQRVPVLWGLWRFHLMRGELCTAQALAEEYLQLAEQTNEVGLLVEAHYVAGTTFLFRGEFVCARAVLERSVALSQPQHHMPPSLSGGFNPRVGSLSNVILALWSLGYPKQALMRSHEALHLAQDLGHPYSLTLALNYASRLHFERGDGRVAQEHADATVALSSKQGFPLYLALGTACRGGALIAQEQWAEGAAQVRQVLETYEVENSRPVSLAWLAKGYKETGQIEDGLAAVAEALRLVDKNDERFYEAELYRIKGELLLAQRSLELGARNMEQKTQSQEQEAENTKQRAGSREQEAEECFLKAIEIAQRQQAKSLELRAVMSLVRLRQRQTLQQVAGSEEQEAKNETAGKPGSVEARRPDLRPSLPASQRSSLRLREQEARTRLAEAHRMLSVIYNWFTEGFDTKDLQEAKALLEDLGEKAKRENGETGESGTS